MHIVHLAKKQGVTFFGPRCSWYGVKICNADQILVKISVRIGTRGDLHKIQLTNLFREFRSTFQPVHWFLSRFPEPGIQFINKRKQISLSEIISESEIQTLNFQSNFQFVVVTSSLGFRASEFLNNVSS